MMRLFVALPLPEELRDRLGGLSGGMDNTRWVDPDNLHLTLRFLGELDGRQARDMAAELSGIDAPAFDMELKGLGTFGSGKKVQALWVGVDGPEPLYRLQTKVEQAAQRIGLAGERRRFKPHVTIARFKGPPGRKLGDFLQAHGLFASGPIYVDRFQLISSQLTPKGPIYRVEAEYPLTPQPSAAEQGVGQSPGV
jgi:2'-5' RNA ligase